MPLSCRSLGGGYFFRLLPKVIAAMTSISNAMVSVTLIGLTPWVLLVDQPRPFCMDSIAVFDKMRKVQIRQAPLRSSWRSACFCVVPKLGTRFQSINP